MRIPALLLALLASCLPAGRAEEAPSLVLATTTSVENSGLLERILPAFREETGIEVRAVAVGSGRALRMLRRGDGDVAILHSPEEEAAYLAEGGSALYRKIFWNEFVIVGPAEDPAGVREGGGAVAAMRKIAGSGALFASRGDSSGTHARERRLWKEAGAAPSPRRLLETGQGMSATLRVASERRAYCLTDRATFAQLSGTLSLAILHEGDPACVNPYAILVPAGVRPARREAALRFAGWLASGNGRRLTAEFRVGGIEAFHPWPEGAPADRPDALPSP